MHDAHHSTSKISEGLMTVGRRAFLGSGLVLPLIGAGAVAAQPKPSGIVPDFPAAWTGYNATYRGTHFGTHRPVYYELVHDVTREGGVLTSRGTEVPDGDRADRDRTNAFTSRHVRIDDATGRLIEERFGVGDRTLWSYAFDVESKRVTGQVRSETGMVAVSGPVEGEPITYFAIDHVLSRLPLLPGFTKPMSFISGDADGSVRETPIQIVCEREQVVRLAGQEVLGYRVALNGPTENSYAMGVRIVLAREPRLVLRTFYQSEYREGPPLFDSHGVDVLTAVNAT